MHHQELLFEKHESNCGSASLTWSFVELTLPSHPSDGDRTSHHVVQGGGGTGYQGQLLPVLGLFVDDPPTHLVMSVSFLDRWEEV